MMVENKAYVTKEQADEYLRKSKMTPPEIFKECVFLVWDKILKDQSDK